MKHVGYLMIALSLWGCSALKTEPSYTKKHPNSHILSKDKKSVKDNLKFQKEHAKAAQKKREELASLHQESSTGEKSLKKKK
jgi:hypothetical protein